MQIERALGAGSFRDGEPDLKYIHAAFSLLALQVYQNFDVFLFYFVERVTISLWILILICVLKNGEGFRCKEDYNGFVFGAKI